MNNYIDNKDNKNQEQAQDQKKEIKTIDDLLEELRVQELDEATSSFYGGRLSSSVLRPVDHVGH